VCMDDIVEAMFTATSRMFLNRSRYTPAYSGPGTHQITREGAHKGLIHETTPFVLAGCSAHYRLHPRPLNPNKLNPNKLNPNKLNPNKLNPNKLNPNVYWYRIGTGQQRAGCYQ
jgi:hypothetical protein